MLEQLISKSSCLKICGLLVALWVGCFLFGNALSLNWTWLSASAVSNFIVLTSLILLLVQAMRDFERMLACSCRSQVIGRVAIITIRFLAIVTVTLVTVSAIVASSYSPL